MSWHAIALAHANLRIKALERQLATLEDTLALFTDREIQRRSFAWGNTSIENGMTREMFAEICEREAHSNRLRDLSTPWEPAANLPGYEQRHNESGHLETRPTFQPTC